jgi:hypothetical protein
MASALQEATDGQEESQSEQDNPSILPPKPRTACDGQAFYGNGKIHHPRVGARPPSIIAGHGRYCVLPWLQGLICNQSPIALSVSGRSPYQVPIIVDLDRRVGRSGAGDGRPVIFEDAAVQWGSDDRRSQRGYRHDGGSRRRLERY